jgi:hypothetical protein
MGKLPQGVHLAPRAAQTVSHSERRLEIKAEDACLEGLRRGGGRECWCIGPEQLDQRGMIGVGLERGRDERRGKVGGAGAGACVWMESSGNAEDFMRVHEGA